MSLLVPTREDFPVLTHTGVAYLDSGATSQTPLPVIEAMDAYYGEYRASVHRGVYPLAARSTEAYEAARVKVAEFVGSTPAETIFTRNATEAINLVAYAWGLRNLQVGDTVVVTEAEHHSNIVPWQIICDHTGASLEFVGIDDDGLLIEEELNTLLSDMGVLMVAITHVSNVLGTINQLESIVERAHSVGARVLVDGAQAVPHMPVDVGALGADFYAWTGHKTYGPTGIGVLHGRRGLLEEMMPFNGGGHMISKVTKERTTYAEPPTKFEAGTPPIAEAIGLGAAIDYLQGVGMETVLGHSREIVSYAYERLASVGGLKIHGPTDLSLRGSAISFALDGIHPHDVAEILGREGVCVRAGHHCAQILMDRLGVSATTRASFAVHTTREEIDRLVEGIAKVQEVFA